MLQNKSDDVSLYILSIFLPDVSKRYLCVTHAPSNDVTTKHNKSVNTPIPCNKIGNKKAVKIAPNLAIDAAKPAPFALIFTGKTSPEIKYVCA